MLVLRLPALVAGRDLADEFVDTLRDVNEVASGVVQVDARELVSGTASFAAQLVRRLIVDEKADSFVLVGAPVKFAGYVLDAAQRLDVSRQVSAQAALANAS